MIWMPFRVLVLLTSLLWLAPALRAVDAPPAANEQAASEPAGPSSPLVLPGLGIKGFGSGPSDPAVFSARFDVQEGSRRGTLSVSAIIEEGWHIYAISQPLAVPGPMPAKIKVTETEQFKVLGPFQPDRPPHHKPPDPNSFNIDTEEHEGDVTWTAPIELAPGVDAASLEIAVAFSGQVCAEACIPLNEKLKAKFAGYTAAPETPGEYRANPRDAELTLLGRIEPAAIAPGGKAKLILTAQPNPGWHIYAYDLKDSGKGAAKPTLIVLNLPAGWKQSAVVASAEPKIDAMSLRVHEEPVTWSVELTAPADSPQGEIILSGYVGVQTCKNAGGCLFPHAVQFRASVPVAAKAEAGQIPLAFTALKRPPASPEGPTARDIVIGPTGYADVAKLAAAAPLPTGDVNVATLVKFIGFGLLGGLILNLMPCVLPVIGLKVLSFAQQGGESRGKIFALNLWFALGLLFVFFLLASAAAFGSLVFGENLAWGQQFTYTWFKVAMIVIVFSFALSFLGVWEVPIPGFAQSGASSSLQQKEGIGGAFFKGVFTTLLATPCSGPFLGPVFAFTLAQPPLVTYLIFLSVGVGMASPYLVIGAFPALVRWLPKPGEWMETVKQLMGFVLLGTTVYLFATLNHAWFIPTLALVIGVWFACWWIGKVPVYEPAGKQIWAWIGGCAAAAMVGYASFTFLAPVQHLYEWKPYSPETIAKLQAEGKTVMIDFTADWCLTCQYNFRTAINTRRVKEVVEKNAVAPVIADWTDRNEQIASKLAELKSRSIPLLVIYPANRPGDVLVLPDTITEAQLIQALEKAGPSQPTTPVSATAETGQPGQPSG
ncbi:MAG: thioredoxin family protein [Pirellulaceae bacterium]|nr:thioredoxin family protein [Pirellulaceae bacterium]